MNEAGDDDKPVWGLKAIGEEIGQTINQTYYMIKNGHLPARQIGEKWVTTKGELRRFIRGEAA